jgi:hypothetical protein
MNREYEYCEFKEATKAEDAASFWDCIYGQRWSITRNKAVQLVEQGQFKTIDDAWVEAEAMCELEDAYRDTNNQVNKYYE